MTELSGRGEKNIRGHTATDAGVEGESDECGWRESVSGYGGKGTLRARTYCNATHTATRNIAMQHTLQHPHTWMRRQGIAVARTHCNATRTATTHIATQHTLQHTCTLLQRQGNAKSKDILQRNTHCNNTYCNATHTATPTHLDAEARERWSKKDRGRRI